jgi:hypothetical protein
MVPERADAGGHPQAPGHLDELPVRHLLVPPRRNNQLLFECGDGTLLVYGRPAPSTADHTQVRLWTDDVDRDVREFEARGAVFEDYDFPTLKTVNHVATTPGIGKAAWFKDPDGNTLAPFQPG